MRKPVIGVIPLFDEEKDSIWMLPGYMDGISEAEGIPFILPLKGSQDDFYQLDERIDGYLFTGGHDVSPSLYGEAKKKVCGTACKDREVIERIIYERALQEDKAVLGICRGIQIINVLEGGTLYQDLPTEYMQNGFNGKPIEHHMTPPYDRTVHQVILEKESPLFSLFEKEKQVAVNSYHHQAIKDLGKKLKAMAVSEDGLIEAIYRPDKKFIWAVQWHPEFIYKKEENARKIFKKFVEASLEK